MEEIKIEQLESLSSENINNYISSIKLSNFRNYKSFKANFRQHPIAFIGKNGVGKTNILESISLMQPGRGIRSVKLEDMSYKHRGNFAVYINLVKNSLKKEFMYFVKDEFYKKYKSNIEIEEVVFSEGSHILGN